MESEEMDVTLPNDNDGEQSTIDPASKSIIKFVNGEITLDQYLAEIKDSLPCLSEDEAEDDDDEDENDKVLDKNVQTEETSTAGDDPWRSLAAGEPADPVLMSTDEEEEEDEETVCASWMLPERRRRGKEKRPSGRPRASAQRPTVKNPAMGTATILYSTGQVPEAIQQCLKMLQTHPRASEPLRMLASIFSGMGDQEKSRDLKLIAAHMGASNSNEWAKIAEELADENPQQAAKCYTSAIHRDPTNYSLYEKRAMLWKQLNMNSHDAYGFTKLLRQMNPETEGPHFITVSKMVSQFFLNDHRYMKAYKILKMVFDRCPSLVTFTEVNVFLELLMTMNRHDECVCLLEQFSDVRLNLKDGKLNDCVVPDDLPIETRVKLVALVLHYGANELADQQIERLTKHEPMLTDLFVEMANALIINNMYEKALTLLLPLTTDDSTAESPDVWSKLGGCYAALGNNEERVRAYERAVQYTDDREVRFAYYESLRALHRYDDAANVLGADRCDRFLYEMCLMYEEIGDQEKFVECTSALLFRHFTRIYGTHDLAKFYAVFRIRRLVAYSSIGYSVAIDNTVSLSDEWDLFKKLYNYYMRCGDYAALQSLCLSSFTSAKFLPKKEDLKVVTIIACVRNRRFDIAFEIMRYLIGYQVNAENQCFWNLMNLMMCNIDARMSHKYAVRLLVRRPELDTMGTIHANVSMSIGAYKHALNDLNTVLAKQPNNPLLLLSSAVMNLMLACQKFATQRTRTIPQALALLKLYEQTRGSSSKQEILYNLGRAFHQMGCLEQAHYYYQKALKAAPPLADPMFDLRCEIAFNLRSIYLNSGQTALAAWVTDKYLYI